MRQSSNSHNVPTLLLGRGETGFPPEHPPDHHSPHIEGWPSNQAWPQENPLPLSDTSSHGANAGAGHYSAADPSGDRSSHAPFVQSFDPINLDADYWQQAPELTQSDVTQPDVTQPDVTQPEVTQPATAERYGQNAYTADDLFFEADAFSVHEGEDGFDPSDGDSVSRMLDDAETEDLSAEILDDSVFGADLFADQFTEPTLNPPQVHRQTERLEGRRGVRQGARQNGRYGKRKTVVRPSQEHYGHKRTAAKRIHFKAGPYPSPERLAKRRVVARQEEDLNYLFGDTAHNNESVGYSSAADDASHYDLGDRDVDHLENNKVANSPLQKTEKLPVKRQLEQGFLQATMAAHSRDYLVLIEQLLGQVVDALPADAGRSPSPLHIQLGSLKLLVKRYGACGLGEQAVLQDALALYAQSDSASLLPVLTGLATRVALKPHLDNGLLNAALVKKLFFAMGESVKLLAVRRQLKALPGLIDRLSRRPIHDRHGLGQLPQQLDRAAMRVTQNPQLYQQLCHYGEQLTDGTPTVHPHADAPQRLRIDGPVEIFFRPLDDLSTYSNNL